MSPYATLADDVITTAIKDDAIKTKGYFIYPSQLFVKITDHANSNDNLNTDLASIFSAIESSPMAIRPKQILKVCLPISTPPAAA